MSGIKESDIVTRQLFAAAYASKKAALEKGDISQARLGFLYDRLVFSKLKEKLGGKVEYLITGGRHITAHLSHHERMTQGHRRSRQRSSISSESVSAHG